MARAVKHGGVALEFLKIAMHCRHFRNLLVMFLESFVKFGASQKGVVRKNVACFARCRYFDNFCPLQHFFPVAISDCKRQYLAQIQLIYFNNSIVRHGKDMIFKLGLEARTFTNEMN